MVPDLCRHLDCAVQMSEPLAAENFELEGLTQNSRNLRFPARPSREPGESSPVISRMQIMNENVNPTLFNQFSRKILPGESLILGHWIREMPPSSPQLGVIGSKLYELLNVPRMGPFITPQHPLSLYTILDFFDDLFGRPGSHVTAPLDSESLKDLFPFVVPKSLNYS